MFFMNICTNSSVLKVIMFLMGLFEIVFTLVPIGLIVMVCIDFSRNVISSNDDEMKKNLSRAIKRIIMAVFLFFIPVIVDFSINALAEKNIEYASCFTNANKEQIAIFEEQEKEQREEEQANRQDQTVGDLSENDSIVSPGASNTGSGKVHFLGFGGNSNSDCILIESNGEFAMIDTSYESSVDTILDYLDGLGVEELEFVLISHAHVDHAAGYNNLSKSIKIKNLYIKVNSQNLHPRYKTVLNAAKRDGTTVKNPEEAGNSTIKLGNITLKLYNIETLNYRVTDNRKCDNGNSLVAVANISGVEIYFAGDIGDYTEYPGVNVNTEVEVAKEIGEVDVYKAAHHGHISFNNQVEALKVLNPTYVVFTNGGPSNVQSSTNRIKNVCSNFKERYITGQGTVILTVSSGGSISIEQL